jgi:hypothetical protein
MPEPPALAGQRVPAAFLNGLPVAAATLAPVSISNSVAELAVATFSFPVGDPSAQVGSGYQFKLYGTADTVLTPTLTFRFRIGTVTGGTFLNGYALTCRTGTNLAWALDAWVYFAGIGSGGSVDGNGYFNESVVASAAAIHPVLGSNTAIDTTSTMNFLVTAQWGTASASNICRSLQGAAYRI